MTRDEAIKEAEGKQVVMRSCWQCNDAHEHLKQADYVVFCAMGCGRLYWKGVEIHRTEFDGRHDNDQVRLSDVVTVNVDLKPPSTAPPRSDLDQSWLRLPGSVLEELCPGVRRRNWPAWAGPYTEPDEPEDK